MSRSRPVRCTSHIPHVQRLFALVNESDVKLQTLAEQIPVHGSTVKAWAYQHSIPDIVNLEAAFNVLGYHLEVVKNDHN